MGDGEVYEWQKKILRVLDSPVKIKMILLNTNILQMGGKKDWDHLLNVCGLPLDVKGEAR